MTDADRQHMRAYIAEYLEEDITPSDADFEGPCIVCGAPLSEFDKADDLLNRKYNAAMRAAGISDGTCYWLKELGQDVTCQKCLWTTEAERVQLMDRRHKELIRQKAIGSGLIHREMLESTFETSDPKMEGVNADVWARAKTWREEKGSLWIVGGIGAGKTYMAHSLLNVILSQGKTIAELRAVEIQPKATAFNWDQCAARYAGVGVLLIDDIDKMNTDAKSAAYLFAVMDSRCSAKRPTIATANVSIKAFRDSLLSRNSDEKVSATIDRFFLPGVPCRHIELKGKSLRSGLQSSSQRTFA